MKRIFAFDSLNKKLLAIFLALTIIPLILTAVVIFNAIEQGFTKLVTNQQKEMEHTVQAQFDKVAEDLLNITTIYAEKEKLVTAFQSKNRDALLQEVNQMYPRLQAEHGIEVFELGDTAGTVFLRGHQPEKFGDDKSDVTAIQGALEKQAISGFEFGSSGLAVRAFAPIIHNNAVIGTLQTGLDDGFLQDINSMLQGVTINLYNQDGIIALSSDEENIGQSRDSAKALPVIKTGKIFSERDGTRSASYLPMYDPTHAEVIGVIGITQDISVIQDTQQRIALITLIITLITLVIVLWVAIRFSKTISNPIKRVAGIMDELSQGNLTVTIDESRRKDEIGQLTTATWVMKNTLHSMIGKVADASSGLAAQSEQLTQSALEVKSGSEQISITMQELAEAAEKQADHASDLAGTTGVFASKIQESSDTGKKVEKAFIDVLELSNDGSKLMEASNRQMVKIDGIVHNAVKRMNQLDLQTQEISKLVSVIQDVANETNLLALNAAIEAARAGEQGKGFAVVASEVRKLSEQVSASITDITKMVTGIQTESSDVTSSLKSGYTEVELGTAHIKKTSETFTEINEAVTAMVASIQTISTNLANFAKDSQTMNSFVEEIAATSEEAAAGVEETAVTSQQSSSSMEEVAIGSEKLASLAEELHGIVKQFRI